MPSSLFRCCFGRGTAGSIRKKVEQPREAGQSRNEATRASLTSFTSRPDSAVDTPVPAGFNANDCRCPISPISVTSRPEEPRTSCTSECRPEVAAQCYTIRKTGKTSIAGLALIFSYNSTAQAPADQLKCDSEIVTHLFRSELKFSAVHTFRNWDRAAVLAELETVSSADHSQWDCLAVISVQHKSNSNSEVMAVSLSLDELISPFLPASNIGPCRNAVVLNDKPKLFLTISHTNDTAPMLLLAPDQANSSALGIGKEFLICGYHGTGDNCYACDCANQLSDAVRNCFSDIADALMELGQRHQPPAVPLVNTLTKKLRLHDQS